MSLLIEIAERRWLPDGAIRLGIRKLLRERLAREARRSEGSANSLIQTLAKSPVALATDAANRQHYEVPPAFFETVLGERLKYSSGFWPRGVTSLDEAEEAMLRLYAERAEISSGQRILDLGCGWGSFSLWVADHFPTVQVTAVSNSRGQKRFIECEANRLGLDNIEVLTADVNELMLGSDKFDRVVSIEMFEHVRNYSVLMRRISEWLRPEGKLFVHIFCHRKFLYPFQTDGRNDWMGRNFFTGGLMPAADTLLHFQRGFCLEERWWLSGKHYEQTARSWLRNCDRYPDQIRASLESVCDVDHLDREVQRWRMFFMACEELFGFKSGQEWGLCHYRFGVQR